MDKFIVFLPMRKENIESEQYLKSEQAQHSNLNIIITHAKRNGIEQA